MRQEDASGRLVRDEMGTHEDVGAGRARTLLGRVRLHLHCMHAVPLKAPYSNPPSSRAVAFVHP